MQRRTALIGATVLLAGLGLTACSGGGGGGGTPSVVGPMRSVSLSLPGVERAMQDRDTPDSEATVKPPRTSRRVSPASALRCASFAR